MKRTGARRLALLTVLAAAVFLLAPSAWADEVSARAADASSLGQASDLYSVPDPSKGYEGADLPAAPQKDGDVWTVVPENAQYALDGAYGSIDGKTIRFSGGPYAEDLVLARTTKFPGSNTLYYDSAYASSGSGAPKSLDELTSTGVYSYVRTVENVTLTAESGVVIPGFQAASGHVYGTASTPAYDYVRETTTSSTTGSHYDICSLKNIVFDGLAIQNRVYAADSSVLAVNDGILFDGCTFLGDAGKMGESWYAAIKMMSDSKSFSNVTVARCTFSKYFQGVYIQGPRSPRIENSLFDRTTHNAIALQSGAGNRVLGEVVIAENIIKHAGDRAVRFGHASDAASVSITNNVMIDSGDLDGNLFKAESLPSDVGTVSLEHNYWDGREPSVAVAGSVLPRTTGVAGGTFLEDIPPEYCAEGFEAVPDGNGGFVVCDHSATETRNAKPASCSEMGYTGDICCATCGTVLEKGEAVPMSDHVFSWVVDKEPTAAEAGSKSELCGICGFRGATIELPATGASGLEPEDPPSVKPLEDGPHTDAQPPADPLRQPLSPTTGDANGLALGFASALFAGICALAGGLAARRRRAHIRTVR